MTQIILDDHIYEDKVLEPIKRWTTVQRLGKLHPGQVIKDERVPSLLCQLRQPTFVTIDDAFWNRGLRDTRYCLIYFPLQSKEQYLIPDLLRRLLKLPEFRTKALRMGKVVRVSTVQVDYWQIGDGQMRKINWAESG